MKFSTAILFLTLVVALTAHESELISNEAIPVILAKNAVFYVAPYHSGRGSAGWPAHLALLPESIQNLPPLLEGIQTFSFEMPNSVTKDDLSFGELEQYECIRQVSKAIEIGSKDETFLKTVYKSRVSLESGVKMNGEKVILSARQGDWLGEITKNGQLFDSYRIEFRPDWNSLKCQQECLDGKEYRLIFDELNGRIGEQVSNVVSVQKIFSTKRECEQAYHDLIERYDGQQITLIRKLDTVRANHSPSIVIEAFHEVLSTTIGEYELIGESTSFPLQLVLPTTPDT